MLEFILFCVLMVVVIYLAFSYNAWLYTKPPKSSNHRAGSREWYDDMTDK